ncbi:MAG: SDR family oxidoreductase [Actinomycetota bacterium]
MDLSAARVLITGASRGIGLEVARKLHAKGATIIGTARSEASLAAAVDELGLIPIVGDLNDPVVADRLIDEALEFGPIDVLVNNAGIEIVGQVAEQDPDDLRAVIGVNLEVPITLARHVLPHMLERGSGRIVNISSMASVVSSPGWATYSASKAGLSSFSRSLKSELAGTGVGVTVVEIGFVQTDMLDDLRSNAFVEASFDRYRSLGLARIMEVDEVAAAIVKAVAKDRNHVRLPKRSIGLSMLANAPRSFADLVQRGVPTK